MDAIRKKMQSMKVVYLISGSTALCTNIIIFRQKQMNCTPRLKSWKKQQKMQILLVKSLMLTSETQERKSASLNQTWRKSLKR